MGEPVFVNAAASRAHHPREVGRAILRGFMGSRYAAYRLALKDIQGAYAKTRLGLLWDLADPLMFGAIFYLLVRAGVLHPGEMAIPYALFVTYGMLLYLTFTEGLLASIRLLRTSRGLLAHVKIAPEALIMSVFFRTLFNSGFRIVVLLTMTAFMVEWPAGGLLHGLLAFVGFLALYPCLILSGMAVGLLLAPFNAIYSDVERIVNLVILPLRFATPVFYTLGNTALILVNPVAVLIVTLRQLGTHQGLYHAEALLFWGAFFTLLFAVGTYLFHLAVPVLAERA